MKAWLPCGALLACATGCGSAYLPQKKLTKEEMIFPGSWGSAVRLPNPEPARMTRMHVVLRGGPSEGMPQPLSLAPLPSSGLQWNFRKAPQEGLFSGELWARGRRVFGVNLKLSGTPEAPEWMSGSLPLFATDTSPLTGAAEVSLQKAIEIAAKQANVDEECLALREEIWIPARNGLVPGYWIAQSDRCSKPLPFSQLIDATDGTVARLIPESFSLDGKARVYKENVVVTPQLSDEVITDLEDKGTSLNGRYFRVRNCHKNLADLVRCLPSAKGTAGVFAADPSDESFDEIFAYYALSSAINWHKSMMSAAARNAYGDFGLQYPIDVLVRAARSTSNSDEPNFDNASYLPHGLHVGDFPAIAVGTGWEKTDPPDPERLQYLGRDADVYWHEFSHHVVIRSITDISGQGLALHEGFADFFTFALSGNNAIGESIVQHQPGALRTGNDTRPISASLVQAEGHIQGEHWSSVLWALRNELGESGGKFVFDRIAWNAVDFLPPSSGYYHAIAAFVKAADTLATELQFDAKAVKVKMLTLFEQRGYFASKEGIAEGNLPPPAPFLNFTDASVETTLVSNPRSYPIYSGVRPDQVSTPLRDWQLRQSCSTSRETTQGGPAALLLFLLPAALFVPSFIAKRRKHDSV